MVSKFMLTVFLPNAALFGAGNKKPLE